MMESFDRNGPSPSPWPLYLAKTLTIAKKLTVIMRVQRINVLRFLPAPAVINLFKAPPCCEASTDPCVTTYPILQRQQQSASTALHQNSWLRYFIEARKCLTGCARKQLHVVHAEFSVAHNNTHNL